MWKQCQQLTYQRENLDQAERPAAAAAQCATVDMVAMPAINAAERSRTVDTDSNK